MMLKNLSLGLFFLMATASLAQDVAVSRKRVDAISKSDQVEFSPTISADGRTMIFETQRGEKWELYQSMQTPDGAWSDPIPLPAINDSCNFLAGPSLSYDGNTLYYTAFIEGVTTSEDIFYSERLSETSWSAPRSIGAPINTADGYEGFPSISADGNSLYFIRINPENEFNRKAKEACFTIYVSHRQNDTLWSEPAPLPAPVNQGCERDPRIMADNHTLIFSSIRENGQGKFDLYQTRLQLDGTWAPVVPLSYVNTAENDQSPCISASGNTMYYLSSDDIYEIEIPKEFRQLINATVHGAITSAGGGPLGAKVTVRNTSTGETFHSESNPGDGKYSIVLGAGAAYEVTFGHDGYVPKVLKFDYASLESYKEEIQNISLTTDFNLALTINDKDLPDNAVKAFVTVKGEAGQSVFSDSVETASSPLTIPMKVGAKYQLAINAPNYPAYQEELVFAGASVMEETTKQVLLEHEKIAFVAQVTDIGTGERKRMKVTYNNETTHEVIVADAGEVVNLRKGDRYSVITNSDKGYAYAIRSILAGEGQVSEQGTFEEAIPVAALAAGSKLALNNIYFETNSAALSDASTLELGSIINLLQNNPQITIEISAHTDNVGAQAYNLSLSQKRANSVIEYLAKKGIPSTQLVAKGYGMSQPLVPNDSEENRAKNRRVELLVLKVD